MQGEIIKDITAYIDFLRKNGLSVTLSCFDKSLEKYLPILFEYEVHLSAVCSFLKANPVTCGKCPQNKRKLEKRKPSEPYYSCCYAGVEEFVVPIIEDGNLICNVSVSGYRGKMRQSRFLAQKHEKQLGAYFGFLYSQLKTDVPDEMYVLQAVNPLKYMFSELKKECLRSFEGGNTASKIYRKALKFIYDNYMNDFTLDDIAKQLNYSESYLRHIFTQHSGKSIAKTVNSIRLSQAAILLETTSLTITQIAVDCGFCDGNYFSTVFKREYGISPKEYRKNKTA